MHVQAAHSGHTWARSHKRPYLQSCSFLQVLGDRLHCVFVDNGLLRYKVRQSQGPDTSVVHREALLSKYAADAGHPGSVRPRSWDS